VKWKLNFCKTFWKKASLWKGEVWLNEQVIECKVTELEKDNGKEREGDCSVEKTRDSVP
jgi:hypothetical protein